MPLAQPLRLFYRREKQGSTLILKDIATDFHEAYSVVPPPFEFRLEILAGQICTDLFYGLAIHYGRR
jgi:hypothetical protein